MSIKPILLNTEMVRAILNGRKSCTRRVVKFPVNRYTNNVPLADKMVLQELRCDKANFLEEPFFSFGMNLPYQPGDILYVRETFAWCPCWDCGMDTEQGACTDHIYHSEKKEHGCYMYRASCKDNEYPSADTWHPSIHMPKEATRIWLKVTDVRVERLQEITIDGIRNEGLSSMAVHAGDMEIALKEWELLWNSTIKKSDLDRHGWDANPWVWIIEFERCEKPKEESEETQHE